MPIDISQHMRDNTNFARTLRSRTFEKFTQEQVEEVLSHMGNVMSLHKIHRKVAVMGVVLFHMETGQILSGGQITERVNEIMIPQNSLHPSGVGHILKLIERWGYIERIFTPYKNYQYRRVK